MIQQTTIRISKTRRQDLAKLSKLKGNPPFWKMADAVIAAGLEAFGVQPLPPEIDLSGDPR